MIRIVYDGPPEAGKTTNVKQLGELISLQRRGAAASPGTHGPRTEFFDWLDFAGGYVDGRKVRCQLVSVPGQPALLHRRRYLLETADAIVFVADSRMAQLSPAADSLEGTRRIVGRLGSPVPVGLVVQANKQDLEGAQSPEVVAQQLRVDAGTPVVGSAAVRSEGVMQTFVLAVRLATDRVRALVLGDALLEDRASGDDPLGLHAVMLALEPPAEEAPPPPAEEAAPPAKTPPVPPPRGVEPPGRSNPLRVRTWPSVPQPMELQSGHIWPPVKGRAALAVASAGGLTAPERVKPWAPEGAMELANEAGWTLHTHAAWAFASEGEARLELLKRVRGLVPRLELLPESRTLLAAKDGLGWRLWLVTPRVTTVRELVSAALEEPAVASLSAAVEQLAQALRVSAFAHLLDEPLRGGAEGVGLHEGRLVQLALEPGAASPVADLQRLLEVQPPALRRWFDEEARPRLQQGGRR